MYVNVRIINKIQKPICMINEHNYNTVRPCYNNETGAPSGHYTQANLDLTMYLVRWW